MKVPIFLFCALALFNHNSSAAMTARSSRQGAEEQLTQIANQLVLAIKNKDLTSLRSFMSKDNELNAIDAVDIAYIFSGEQWRQESTNKNSRSILELIDMGQIQHQIKLSVDGQAATIFFIPGSYLQESRSNPKFFEEFWTEKYFACLFEKTPNRWAMKYTFCYSQTDGPIENDPR